MIQTITGDDAHIQSFRDKKATFMLALSNTATADIPGITQAGIPGMIHLTPTLDAEFLATGEVRSLPNVAETPKGVPTPALITRAVHLLHPYARIELLDLGLKVPPQGDDLTLYRFGIEPAHSIAERARIDAKAVFEKGLEFGRTYECVDDYVILAESVPSGTTTATATALALGYDARTLFSSSFKNVPNSIRETTIEQALSYVDTDDDLFAILGSVSDNMLIFNAGFILGVGGRFPIVLAGGTQMAAVLLVVNCLLEESDPQTIHGFATNHLRSLEGSDPQTIHRFATNHLRSDPYVLWTTKWVAEDPHSDIKALLEMADLPVDAFYADFDFGLCEHPALKLYDEGEAKEGVGAGGALVYGYLNGLSKDTITKQVEKFLT